MAFAPEVASYANDLLGLLAAHKYRRVRRRHGSVSAQTLHTALKSMINDRTDHTETDLQTLFNGLQLEDFLQNYGLITHGTDSIRTHFERILSAPALAAMKTRVDDHLRRVQQYSEYLEGLLITLNPYKGEDASAKVLYEYLNALYTNGTHHTPTRFRDLMVPLAGHMENFLKNYGLKKEGSKEIKDVFAPILPATNKARIDTHLERVRKIFPYVKGLVDILTPYTSGSKLDENAVFLREQLNPIYTHTIHYLPTEFRKKMQDFASQLEAFLIAHGSTPDGDVTIRDRFEDIIPDSIKDKIDTQLQERAKWEKIKQILTRYCGGNPEYKVLMDKCEELEKKNLTTPTAILPKLKEALDDKDAPVLGKAANALLAKHGNELDLDTKESLIERLAPILALDRYKDYVTAVLKLLHPYTNSDSKYDAYAQGLYARLQKCNESSLTLAQIQAALAAEILRNEDNAHNFFVRFVTTDKVLIQTLLPLLPKDHQAEVRELLDSAENESKQIHSLQTTSKPAFMELLQPQEAWLAAREMRKAQIAKEINQDRKLTALQNYWLHRATGEENPRVPGDTFLNAYSYTENYVEDMKHLLDGQTVNYDTAGHRAAGARVYTGRYVAAAPGITDDQIVEQIVAYEQKRIEVAMSPEDEKVPGSGGYDIKHFKKMKDDIATKLHAELAEAHTRFEIETKKEKGDGENEAAVEQQYKDSLQTINNIEADCKAANPTLYATTNFPAVFALARSRLHDAYEAAKKHCEIKNWWFFYRKKTQESVLVGSEAAFKTANNALTLGFTNELKEVEIQFKILQKQTLDKTTETLTSSAHKHKVMELVKKQRRVPAVTGDELKTDLKTLASTYVTEGMEPIKKYYTKQADDARRAVTVALQAATPSAEQAKKMQLATFLKIKAGRDANKGFDGVSGGEEKAIDERHEGQLRSEMAKPELVMRTNWRGGKRDTIDKVGSHHIAKTKSDNPEMMVKWFLNSLDLLKLHGKQKTICVPAKLELVMRGILDAYGERNKEIAGKMRIVVIGKRKKFDSAESSKLYGKGFKAYKDHFKEEVATVIERGAEEGRYPKTQAKIDPQDVAAFHTPGLGYSAAPAA